MGLASWNPVNPDSLLIGLLGVAENFGEAEGHLGPEPSSEGVIEGFLGLTLDLQLIEPVSKDPLMALSYCMPSSLTLSMVLL